MDNLTHTLTGLMLSRAGLNRYYARAGLVLMISANAPDIDVVSLAGGPLDYLQYHRWYAHAIAMMPVMAAIAVLIACAVARSFKGWRVAYGLALIGVASHLLLDWTNAYGIRLLLPFSSRWLHLDATSVVDVWIWAVLMLCTVGPALARLVSAEIGAKPGSGRFLAIAALSFLAVYDYGRFLLHQRAITSLNSRLYGGRPAERVAAFPVGSVNPMSWTGWVQTGDESIRYSMDLAGEFDPSSGKVFYNAAPSPAIETAKKTEVFQKFGAFAIYPLWRILPAADPENGKRVDLTDWRFSFTATALLDSANDVEKTYFHF